MNYPRSAISVLSIFIAVGCASPHQPTTTSEFYTAADFASVKKTDAHIHIQTNEPAPLEQAVEDNFHLFTINYDDVNEPPAMEIQQEFALNQVNRYPGNIAYATTISIRNFNSAEWMDQTLSYIKASISKGAKAVKVYKVIGMSLRDTSGRLLMIDDPVFDPLFNYLEENHIPVVGHLGEPRNCWLPLDKMTIRGDASYFKSQPEYHMYLHPELPSYEDQINARDNLLAKHPRLNFVGAHLGSLEYNVDSLSARLDRFPQMSVDMAARIVHLQLQARDNPQKIRDFVIKYSTRLLYATDIVTNVDDDTIARRKSMHEIWTRDWKFLTSDEKMTSSEFDGTFTGLKLPRKVVDDIYYNNAKRILKIF